MQNRLIPAVCSLLFCLFVTSGASGQEVLLSPVKKGVSSILHESVKWEHITPALMASESGQAAMAEYHYLKDNGLLPARKGGSQPIGEKRNFSVLNIRTNTEGNVEFTLMAEGTKFNLWVETTQLVAGGGRVTASDISALATAIGSQTPAGSVDPTKGVVAVDEMVFGPPSDVDGSGKMDVLLHDIQDFYDPNNGNFSAVGGFYYPKDLTIPNNRDIVHLDTVPGMYSQSGVPQSQANLHQTLAHEYEHLIMQANKGTEIAFINEGQAEWAEVVNGYTPRTVSYLNSSFERSRSLLSFREDQPYGGPDSEDYQRGGLWTNYLADRLGYELMGEVARTLGTGRTTYVNMLNANEYPIAILDDFVQGFHVANLINDGSSISNFGYTSAARQSVMVQGIPEIDGKTAVETVNSGTINPGAVVYQKWTDVGTFNLNMTVTNTAFNADLKPVLIFDASNGTRSFEELSPGGEGVQKTGNFTSVQLVIPHVDLASAQAVTFNYTASWSEYTGTASIENVVYDNGTVHHEVSGNSILIIGDSVPSDPGGFFAETDKFANKFVVPAGGALIEVSVSMMFVSDLDPSATNSNVKDFKLTIWNDNAGKPGSALVSDVFTYTGGSTAPTLGFQTISLIPYQNILKTASGTIYASIENAGTDNNYMYFIVAYTPAPIVSPSFMFNNFSPGTGPQRWASFDALTSGGQPAFTGQVLPIRGKIDLNAGSTANEEESVLPRAISLEQNYPNPFNPTTSIQFSLPAAALVRLEVYDLLGRSVATLHNGMMQPGTHSLQFDASRLNSGLYLYSLQVGDQKMTRTMTLIK